MLQCEDCKRSSLDDERDWITLRFEAENGGQPVLLVYCPQCADQFRVVPARPASPA